MPNVKFWDFPVAKRKIILRGKSVNEFHINFGARVSMDGDLTASLLQLLPGAAPGAPLPAQPPASDAHAPMRSAPTALPEQAKQEAPPPRAGDAAPGAGDVVGLPAASQPPRMGCFPPAQAPPIERPAAAASDDANSEDSSDSSSEGGASAAPRPPPPPGAAPGGGLPVTVPKSSARRGLALRRECSHYLFGAHTVPLDVTLVGPPPEEEVWRAQVSADWELRCPEMLEALAGAGDTLVLHPAGRRRHRPAASVRLQPIARRTRGAQQPGGGGAARADGRLPRAPPQPAPPQPAPPQPAPPQPAPPRRGQGAAGGQGGRASRNATWDLEGGEEVLVKAVTSRMVSGKLWWSRVNYQRLAGTTHLSSEVLLSTGPTTWRVPVVVEPNGSRAAGCKGSAERLRAAPLPRGKHGRKVLRLERASTSATAEIIDELQVEMGEQLVFKRGAPQGPQGGAPVILVARRRRPAAAGTARAGVGSKRARASEGARAGGRPASQPAPPPGGAMALVNQLHPLLQRAGVPPLQIVGFISGFLRADAATQATVVTLVRQAGGAGGGAGAVRELVGACAAAFPRA
jgi:hypothetical protein